MHENSLSRNITVTADDGYHTGKMKVIPYNDFHKDQFEIQYEAVNPGPDPGPTPDPHKGLETWEIILIIVSAVVFALLIGYLLFLCWKRRQTKPVE